MSSVYTPNSAVNPTTFTQPSDGDNENAASVKVFLQGLADKAAHMNLPEQNAAERYKFLSQDFTYCVPIRAVVQNDGTANKPGWLSGAGGLLYQQDLVLQPSLFEYLDLPDTSTLKLDNVGVYLQAQAGHGGVLPTNLPSIYIRKRAIATGAVTTLASTAPIVPVSAATYETLTGYYMTSFTSGTTVTITRSTHVFYVEVTGETGGSAVVGLQYHGCRMVFTSALIDQGAS